MAFRIWPPEVEWSISIGLTVADWLKRWVWHQIKPQSRSEHPLTGLSFLKENTIKTERSLCLEISRGFFNKTMTQWEMQSKMWHCIVLIEFKKILMRYLNPVQSPFTYNVILNSFEKVCIDFEKIFKSDSTSFCVERSGRSFPKGASPKRPTGGCRYTWHNNVWGK